MKKSTNLKKEVKKAGAKKQEVKVGGPGGVADNLERTKDVVKHAKTLDTIRDSGEDEQKAKGGVIDSLARQQRDKGAIRVVYQMTRKKIAEAGGFRALPVQGRLKKIATMVQASMRETLSEKRCLGVFLKYDKEQKFLKWTDDQVIDSLEAGDWAAFDGCLKAIDERLKEDANLDGRDMVLLRKRIDGLRINLNIFQIARTKAEGQLARIQRLFQQPTSPDVRSLEAEFQCCAALAEEVHEKVLGFTSEIRKLGWGRVPACPVGHALKHHQISIDEHEVYDDQLAPGHGQYGKSATEPTNRASVKVRQSRAFEKASTKALDTVSKFLHKADSAAKAAKRSSEKQQAVGQDKEAVGGQQDGGRTGPSRQTVSRPTTGDVASTPSSEKTMGKFVARAHEVGQRVSLTKQQASYLNKFTKSKTTGVEQEAETPVQPPTTPFGKTNTGGKKKVLCNGCDQKLVVDQKVWKCYRCSPTCLFCQNCLKGISLKELSSLSCRTIHEHELVWMSSVQELLEEPCKGWAEGIQDFHNILMTKKGVQQKIGNVVRKHKFVISMLAGQIRENEKGVKFDDSSGAYAVRKSMARGARRTVRNLDERKSIAKPKGNRKTMTSRKTMAKAEESVRPSKTASALNNDGTRGDGTLGIGTDQALSPYSPKSTRANSPDFNHCATPDLPNKRDSYCLRGSRRTYSKERPSARFAGLDSDSSTESAGSSGSEEDCEHWEVTSCVGGLWTVKPDGALVKASVGSNRVTTRHPISESQSRTWTVDLQEEPEPSPLGGRRLGLVYTDQDGKVLRNMFVGRSAGHGHSQRGWSVADETQVGFEALRKGRTSLAARKAQSTSAYADEIARNQSIFGSKQDAMASTAMQAQDISVISGRHTLAQNADKPEHMLSYQTNAVLVNDRPDVSSPGAFDALTAKALQQKPPDINRSLKSRFQDAMRHLWEKARPETRFWRMRSPETVEEVMSSTFSSVTFTCRSKTNDNCDELDGITCDEFEGEQYADLRILEMCRPATSLSPACGSATTVLQSRSGTADSACNESLPWSVGPQDLEDWGANELPFHSSRGLRATKALQRKYNLPQSQADFRSPPGKYGVRPDCWRFPFLPGREDLASNLVGFDPLDIEPIT